MEIYKAAVIGTGSVLLGLFFKNCREEYALYISLAAGILILGLAVGRLGELLDTVKLMQKQLGLEESYLRILLKMLAVTYIAQFASAICKDSGNSAIAGQIDLFARLTLAALGVPVFTALISLITGILTV